MPKGERPSPDVHSLIHLSNHVFGELHQLSTQFNPEENNQFHPKLEDKIKGVLQPFFHTMRQELSAAQSKINFGVGPTNTSDESSTNFELYPPDSKEFSTGIYRVHDRPHRDSLLLIIKDSRFQVAVSESLEWSTDRTNTLTIETEDTRNNATRTLNLRIEEGFTTQKDRFDPFLAVIGKSSRVHQVNGYENSFYIRTNSAGFKPFLPLGLLR